MGKGKPRQNPDKPANKMGKFCSYCDSYTDENGNEILIACCGMLPGKDHLKTCQGNPHNCIKTYYHRLASRSNKQINDNIYS